jgi:hypothetical protein
VGRISGGARAVIAGPQSARIRRGACERRTFRGETRRNAMAETTVKPGADIVPIGKYKGQPVEVLQGDPQYVEWLMGQDWVRTKYPQLFTLIVNNFGEPTETPEHNKLQAMFLDEEFRGRVFDSFPNARWWTAAIRSDDHFNKIVEIFDPERRRTKANRDYGELAIEFDYPFKYSFGKEQEAANNEVSEYINKSFREAAGDIRKLKSEAAYPLKFEAPQIDFESKGADIHMKYRGVSTVHTSSYSGGMAIVAETDNLTIRIEIKPSMGDDFPAVLRQMKANQCDVLYLDAYTGVGATLEQVIKMFAASGIKVLLHKDFVAAVKAV